MGFFSKNQKNVKIFHNIVYNVNIKIFNRGDKFGKKK